MKHVTAKPSRTPVLVLAIASLVLLSGANASQASVTPQPVLKAGVAMTQTPRAKRAAKKPRQVVAKVAPRMATSTVTVPLAATALAAAPVMMELKPSATLGMNMPAPAPAYPPPVNPYLVHQVQVEPVATNPVPAVNSAPPSTGGGFRLAMPHIPIFEQAILPRVKKVYPTGEKPLVVVTFKCPTEMVGIDTPSTIILHKVVNGGMDLVNKSNLLSFNMQQVCQ